MPRLVRITTVPVSLQVLLRGQMKYMAEQGYEVSMISAAGKEVPALKQQEACEHYVVPFTRTISPLADLKALIQLTRLLKKLKPDIVHTHTPKAGLIGMWAAWFAGVPVRLHTIAGLPWMETTGAMRLLLKTMEKATAWPAHRVYPNSHALLSFLTAEGVAPHKMQVIGSGSSNGINCDHFSLQPELQKAAMRLREEAQVPANGWVWIFIGRLVKDKGLAELLDAFMLLHEQFPEDRLWLLGDAEPELDPLSAAHQQYIQTHPAIKAWGFQPDVRPYLAAAAVLTFPSYREGFPNVPMQAGAMGCMLILSNINGCNEIVQDGTDGKLVPVKNTQALLQAMLYARQHTAERDRMAAAIREKMKHQYDQQNLWRLIATEYTYWLTNNKRP